MNNINFRDLTADDIEVRIASIKDAENGRKGGVSLLLYKTARCDMNILDETVGNLNWQRRHLDHKNNMYCQIGININYNDPSAEPVWVWKEDCGTENYTEKEKSEASDSFKRAGFNWGIGRELYTSPFIWIDSDHCKISTDAKGKLVCYDRFFVSRIQIEKKKITALEIKKQVRGGAETVFSFGYFENPTIKPQPKIEAAPEVICPKCGKVMLAENWQGKRRTPAELMEKLGSCVECYLTKR